MMDGCHAHVHSQGCLRQLLRCCAARDAKRQQNDTSCESPPTPSMNREQPRWGLHCGMAKIGSGASALCLFTVAMLLARVVLAQSTTKVASPPAAAIPLSDVATEAESVTATLREIQSDLSFDRSTDAIAQQLPDLTKEIDDRLRESRKIIVQSPSIEMLRSLEGEWQRLRRELSEL